MNRHFVSIKVDREERPDVDDIYMAAVQTMTGSGGWPLSLFLTPERKPFYGGTYFPPEDRYGRPGFVTLLHAVAQAWKTRRGELETSAADLLAHLEEGAKAPPGAAPVGPEILEAAARALASQFDPRHGGFGAAPKFPPAMRLEFLIRYHLRTGEPSAREMVEATLAKMAAGGMYDQVGGGFHRYSTDERWLVPHFEKMLYDNALLARVYLLAFRAFGNPDDARIARETLDYLLAEMTPESGGFFAAQDADSEGREGVFYVWDPRTLEEAVGKDAAPIVAARFGVTEAGNFEDGQTVLSIAASVPDLALRFGRSEEEIAALLDDARRRMYEARSRRVWPGRDEKLLTDWTALAVSAFALAGRVLSRAALRDGGAGGRRPDPAQLPPGGILLHREKDGSAGIPGFASDYANLVEALLDLYEATFEPGLLPRGGRPAEGPRRPLLRPRRRLLPRVRRPRRAPLPAAGDLRRRDPFVQLGRGHEPPPSLLLHGRGAVPRSRGGALLPLLDFRSRGPARRCRGSSAPWTTAATRRRRSSWPESRAGRTSNRCAGPSSRAPA